LVLKTEGPVHDRSATYARYLWIAVVPLFFAISLESWVVRPELPGAAIYNPLCWLGILIVIVATATLISGLRTGRESRAFLASNFLLAGLLITGGAAIFPVMLYSTLSPQDSLTAYAVAANHTSLLIASIWWPIGFALATIYFVFISRRYAGKVSVKRDNQGFY
jgi:cytochrome d ubiquinol oxidase subunit II